MHNPNHLNFRLDPVAGEEFARLVKAVPLSKSQAARLVFAAGLRAVAEEGASALLGDLQAAKSA